MEEKWGIYSQKTISKWLGGTIWGACSRLVGKRESGTRGGHPRAPATPDPPLLRCHTAGPQRWAPANQRSPRGRLGTLGASPAPRVSRTNGRAPRVARSTSPSSPCVRRNLRWSRCTPIGLCTGPHPESAWQPGNSVFDRFCALSSFFTSVWRVTHSIHQK